MLDQIDVWLLKKFTQISHYCERRFDCNNFVLAIIIGRVSKLLTPIAIGFSLVSDVHHVMFIMFAAIILFIGYIALRDAVEIQEIERQVYRGIRSGLGNVREFDCDERYMGLIALIIWISVSAVGWMPGLVAIASCYFLAALIQDYFLAVTPLPPGSVRDGQRQHKIVMRPAQIAM